MILFRGNTEDLEVITSHAADIEVHLSVMQVDNSTPPVVQPIPSFGPRASITTATTTQILDSSGLTSGHAYNLKHAQFYNNHASQSCTVTVQSNDGTDTSVLAKVLLLAGEMLVLTQGGVWIHYDANGGVYPSVGNAASQAEMEAGTATDRYVTPQGMNWHPGVAKCWGKANGTGTSLLANWNIAGISDTGTGRLGWTVGTDFSSTNWSALTSLQRIATTLTVATVDLGGGTFRNAGQTAGVIESENYDETATTNVAQDPEFYYMAGFGDQ